MQTITEEQLIARLDAALAARAVVLDADARHQGAMRLFSGFYEGAPDLVADCYAATLVLHNYAERPADGDASVAAAARFYRERLPWLRAVIVKLRNAPTEAERHGTLLYGERPDDRIREDDVWYAVDLLAYRDAGFYLDTRDLRAWLRAHVLARSVLNTFAYTGSLGVAAVAGGAARVVQTDLRRDYLNVAKTSHTLNGFPINKADFRAGDFFAQVAHMKRAGERYDCAIVDPPFFAAGSKGTVDLVRESHRVINKVRPLINDGGALVAINNALFVPGADYLRTLEALCADGYLSIEHLIPVPPDCTGSPATRVRAPLVDPAPFNHSTKIAVLRVRRKAA